MSKPALRSINGSGGGSTPPNQTAAYIEDLVREMESLALKDGFTRLSDILKSAREEAHRLLNDNS